MANISIVHTETHDETKPSGSRARSLGDDDIREKDRAVRERLAVDHISPADETGEGGVGLHKQVRMRTSASAPTQYDDIGSIYLKTVSGIIELFYEDSSGNEIQLTSGGLIKDSVQAKTGDWMMSSVTTARTGWTNVSATYSNRFIRINATPLTTGGADTHTTPAHILQTGEIPPHYHALPLYNPCNYAASGVPYGLGGVGSTNYSGLTTLTDGGSGGGHTHDAADNVPAYVQGVLFQKD